MARRKWNPSQHPRDGRGRFSEGGAASWAGKIGDKIGAKRGESGPDRAARDKHNADILAEGVAFQNANYDVDDDDEFDSESFDPGDQELQQLLDDLAKAMGNPDGPGKVGNGPRDDERADKLADELRRFVVANGYTDDSDMPKWSDQVNDRLPGGDRPDSAGTPIENAFGDGINTPEGGEGSAQMLADHIETLRDDYEVYNPVNGEWELVDDAYETDEYAGDTDVDDELSAYIDITTKGDHFTADATESVQVRKKLPPALSSSTALQGDIVGRKFATREENDRWVADNGGGVVAQKLQDLLRADSFDNPAISEILDALSAAGTRRDPDRLAAAIEKANKYLRNRSAGGTTPELDRKTSTWRSR